MAVLGSVRSYLGVAKEATKGTAVSPTAFIPVAVGKIKPIDVVAPLFDEGLRGSSVKEYAYIQGRQHSTFEFGGAAFADTIGWALGGVLGSVATTTGTPNTHIISLKNSVGSVGSDTQPTAFTLTDFYTAQNRAYAGCQIHDLAFNFSSEGLLEYDAKATGFASAQTAATAPSWSTVLPTPVWAATVSINSATIANAVEGSITMTRSANPIFGLNGGGTNPRNPYAVFLGPLEVKGQLKFVMEDDTQLTNFLSNNQYPLTINWAQGSGASATQISATISKGAYTAAVIDRSKDFVEVMVDLTGISNTTDAGSTGGYSPIKWTLQNTIGANIYQ